MADIQEQIQELKEKVGQGAENIIASGMGLYRRGKKYKCPNSINHKHGDRNPSMSWHPDALHLYCFTCKEKIDIYRYLRESEGMSHSEIMEKYGLEEEKPKEDFGKQLQDISTACIEYMAKRKITKATLDHFGARGYKGNIAFAYYENGIVTGVKYRQPVAKPAGAKYMSITGSDFGLYNRQNIKPEGELVVCEGEIDAMVVHQCGYPNVVSVPTGANSLDKIFRKEKRFFEKFSTIVVASDNDIHGTNMDRAFMETFGDRVKLVDKKLFKGKDLNYELFKEGEHKIKEIIESARVKIEGFRDLDEEPYKGLIATGGSYIPTGMPTIDYAINDLSPGCVTLITGRTNDGKSTFVNQIMANAIDKGNSVLLITGEGKQEFLINKFYAAIIGRNKEHYDYVKVNKRSFKEPKRHVQDALEKWHKKKLKIFSKGDSDLKNTKQLFSLLSSELKIGRQGLVVVDNLMSVLSVEKASEKLEAQADFMQRCCDLARAENTHIILVLHPNKTARKDELMDIEQISGTQDLGNKADSIIVVKKERDEDKLARGISGQIAIVKNRYFPDLPTVNTYYEPETELLLEMGEDNSYVAYGFKWRQYLDGKQETIEFEEITSADCPF